MTTMPEDVRTALITELYRQADELDWDTKTASDRTEQYNRWLDAPKIGQVLLAYMSREGARVWLKDGPMKERNRALNGRGPNAALVPRRAPGASQMVKAALGPDWEVEEASLEDKPARCLVSRGEENRLVIWGPSKNLRDLVFAAVVARADRRPSPIIVITSRPGQEPSTADKRRQKAICDSANVELRHITERLVPVATGVTIP